jgi:iron complex outermembrane receptor protein
MHRLRAGKQKGREYMSRKSNAYRHGTALRLTLAVAALTWPGASFAQSTEPVPASPAQPPAAAPQDPQQPGQGLDDIVVTAQFRRENIQDTPLAITAATGAMMEARSQNNIVDVASRAPNVSLAPAGQGFGSSSTAFIRGIGQSDFNFALEPGVGMYVDDVYYGVLFGSIFELVDLDRVEVLRGPQGTLAGKNSIGGAIKLFSKKPNKETAGYVEATYGRYNRIDLRGGFNVTLAPDTLFLRLSGLSKHVDGYLDRLDYTCVTGQAAPSSARTSTGCKIGTEGGKKLWALRANLRWIVSDRIENNLIVDRTDESSEPPATKLLFQGGAWPGTNNYITGPTSYTNYENYIANPGQPSQYPVPPVNNMRSWGISDTIDVDLGSHVSLKSITALRETSGEFVQAADASPAAQFTHYWNLRHRQFSQELRLSGRVGSFADWTIGGFYYDAKSRLAGHINVSGGLVVGGGAAILPSGNHANLAEFLFDDPVNSTSKSGFAHIVLHPTGNLNITGGVRYTKEAKDYTFTRLAPDGSPSPTLAPLNGYRGVYSGDRWDYRIAVDYKLSNSVLLYAQTSTGFKGGGINPRPFFVNQAVPFGQETLTAYEAGFKSELFDHAVRLNVAGFHNLYRDIQLGLLTCPAPQTATPCNEPANVGNARINGIEGEIEAHPVDGLIIDISGSYLDFKYTKVNPLTGVTLSMTTPYTPKWKFSTGVQYKVQIGGGSSITPRLDYVYQSSLYNGAVNNAANLIDAYGLFNGRVTYASAGGTWEVAASVTNITNKFYYLNKYERQAAPYFLVNGQPGRPREWAVTVKRRF